MMQIDWEQLRLTLQPHAWRGGAVLQGLLRAMYSPLKSRHETFGRYVAQEERERGYDSTVKNLRRAIAERIGTSEGAVQIADVANRDYVELHPARDGAARLVELGEVALWSEDMVQWNREFVVRLPAEWRSCDAEVRAVVERYKMAASRYEIEYI